MIEGTAHLAYDSAAGAYHYDIRPPNAQYVRITTDLLLELVEAKVRTLPGRCVLVRHDLLGSHVEPKPEPAKADSKPAEAAAGGDDRGHHREADSRADLVADVDDAGSQSALFRACSRNRRTE